MQRLASELLDFSIFDLLSANLCLILQLAHLFFLVERYHVLRYFA